LTRLNPKSIIDFIIRIVYNRRMSKVKTVRVVSESEHQRAKLFEDIIKGLEHYDCSTGTFTDKQNYNIFFNFSGFENDKALLLSEFIELRNSGAVIIYDISDEQFFETPDADYYILLAATANFITCSSELIQETLYEQTGRLAYLVADPIDASVFTPPTESSSAKDDLDNQDPRILWYGEARDIMSVRPFITKNPYNIKIATTTHLRHIKDRAETAILLSKKRKDKEIQEADISPRRLS